MKRENLKKTAVISGILTVILTAVMDFALFPMIEKTTEGLRSFDLCSFGYPPEQAERFLSLLSEEGRSVYLNVQLPLDFIYPFVYTAFFISMMALFSAKWKATSVFPVLLFVLDYAENILSVIMLKSETFSRGIATAASAVTVAKTVFMTLTAVVIVVQIIVFCLKNKKTKAAEG